VSDALRNASETRSGRIWCLEGPRQLNPNRKALRASPGTSRRRLGDGYHAKWQAGGPPHGSNQARKSLQR
jgi:hypothetical protein